MRKGTLLLIYLILNAYLNVGFATADGSYAFYDDFNDNSLDTAKWTEDVVGSGNSYTEANGEAQFVIFGHGGWEKGHSTLVSRWIELGNWKSITITGRWKFTDPHTAEMVMGIDGPAKGQHIWVHYVSWEGPKITYRYGSTSKSEGREIPTEYVPFKLVVYQDHFEFWEDGKLVTTIETDCMKDAGRIKLTIGGWDASPLVSHVYFDDVGVSYEPVVTSTPSETATGSPSETTTTPEASGTTPGGGTCGPAILVLLPITVAAIWRKRR